MTNVKRKGNNGELALAKFLSDNGVKCFRNSSSGGGLNKSDLHNSIGYNIEVKTVGRINLQEAWKQSERDASKTHTTPSLFIHFDRMREDEWLVVLNINDWLELILGESEDIKPEIDTQKGRNIAYKLETARNAVKALLKEIE